MQQGVLARIFRLYLVECVSRLSPSWIEVEMICRDLGGQDHDVQLYLGSQERTDGGAGVGGLKNVGRYKQKFFAAQAPH